MEQKQTCGSGYRNEDFSNLPQKIILAGLAVFNTRGQAIFSNQELRPRKRRDNYVVEPFLTRDSTGFACALRLLQKLRKRISTSG